MSIDKHQTRLEAKEIEARKLLETHLEAAHSMYSFLNYMGYEDTQDEAEGAYAYTARWRQHDIIKDALALVATQSKENK